MPIEKAIRDKYTLHPRNRNREPYNLAALITEEPELSKYVKPNKYGYDSIDFANPRAVKLLNKGLLKHSYGVQHWEFPEDNLCPPIPGRADYIHYVADMLGESNFGRIPVGEKITCLDIGTGASCIYPIIGVIEYDWDFIASDSEAKSVAIAQAIIAANPQLDGRIDCRLQNNNKHFFKGIVHREDRIDISICNPPFHSSATDAQSGTNRKVRNLSGKNEKTSTLNFAGMSNELHYEGGEAAFINGMISESTGFGRQVYWFSTLVSKQSNLKGIYRALEHFKATDIKTITMGTGNKSSRVVAWTFLSKEEQKKWGADRWNKKIKA